MALNSADFDTLRGLDLAFAGLQAEANLIRLRLALKAGFDPNQPRVPAGSPTAANGPMVRAQAAYSSLKTFPAIQCAAESASALVYAKRRPPKKR